MGGCHAWDGNHLLDFLHGIYQLPLSPPAQLPLSANPKPTHGPGKTSWRELDAWQLDQPRLGSNERLQLKYLRSVSRHSMFVECVEQTMLTESGANILLIFLRLYCSLKDESNQSAGWLTIKFYR
jgi:hypothetical protein